MRTLGLETSALIFLIQLNFKGEKMDIPDNLLYSEDHEWIEVESNLCLIGITEFAQGELGDIIFMELPEVGLEVSKGDSIGTIEAVKTVADVYSPINGEVIEVNLSLEDNPELLNNDPYGDGWIIKIKPSNEINASEHLTSSQYKKFIGK